MLFYSDPWSFLADPLKSVIKKKNTALKLEIILDFVVSYYSYFQIFYFHILFNRNVAFTITKAEKKSPNCMCSKTTAKLFFNNLFCSKECLTKL